ncbi:uncharacterized protein LOC144748339 [Ciona intestinalis]
MFVFLLSLLNVCSSTVRCQSTCPPPSNIPMLSNSEALSSYLKLSVQCTQKQVTISVGRCEIDHLSDHSSIKLADPRNPRFLMKPNNPTCLFKFLNFTGNITTNHGTCGGPQVTLNDRVVYEYAIVSIYNKSLIDQREPVFLKFSCQLVQFTLPPLVIDVLPFTMSQSVNLSVPGGSCFVIGGIPTEQTNVTIPSPVSVGFLGRTSNSLRMQVQRCWVTPNTNITDSTIRTVSRNNLKKSLWNGLMLSFNSFSWPSSIPSILYIHCQVTCGIVGRASAVNQKPISMGPIQINRGPICGAANGECEDLCTQDIHGNRECLCFDGRVVTQNNLECAEASSITTQQSELHLLTSVSTILVERNSTTRRQPHIINFPWWISLAIALPGMFILFAIIGITCAIRKRRRKVSILRPARLVRLTSVSQTVVWPFTTPPPEIDNVINLPHPVRQIRVTPLPRNSMQPILPYYVREPPPAYTKTPREIPIS